MKTHRLQHVGFVKFYNEFKKEFRKVYKPKDMRREDLQKLIDKTRKFLGDWLVNHINGQDHKYAASAGKDDSYRIYIEQLFGFLEKTGAIPFLITETEQVPKIFSTIE